MCEQTSVVLYTVIQYINQAGLTDEEYDLLINYLQEQKTKDLEEYKTPEQPIFIS